MYESDPKSSFSILETAMRFQLRTPELGQHTGKCRIIPDDGVVYRDLLAIRSHPTRQRPHYFRRMAGSGQAPRLVKPRAIAALP